jgi:predicted dehydrogenase
VQKVGIVGCGRWGANYVRVLSELQEAEVVWVCDQDRKQLDLMARRYPNAAVLTDLAEAVARPDTDAVVVATPAAAHYRAVKLALRAGKHVLSEKPLTTKVEEAEELGALAEKQGVVLMVGHTFLYNSAIRKMKSYIQDDDFGQIYYLHATRTHLGLIRPDVNAIWDLAPHDISIFNYLLEAAPIKVSAVGSRILKKDREDVGFVSLTYPKNIVGNIHVSWIDSNKVRELVVVGSKKRIVFNDLDNLEKIRIFEKGVAIEGQVDSFGEFQLLLRDGDIISPRIDTSEPLKNQCLHWLDCLEHGKKPLTDARNAVDVIRVMTAIDRSLSLEGVPVEV